MSNSQPCPRRAAALLCLLSGSLVVPACTSGDADGTTETDGDTEGQMLPQGCDAFVGPGDDAQEHLVTALVDVEPGETICMGAGTFSITRQLLVATDDITLRGEGMEETILDFSGQISGGNGILIQSNRVTVEDFAVIDTPGDGIRSNAVDGGVYRRIKAGWTAEESVDNGAYALYPVQSSNIHIDGCITYNARDAGLYIGQSNNVLIENSEAYGNVIGLEIENTTDSIARNNHVHGNTSGILVINLPGLDIFDGKRANVHDNIVVDNNIDNFGDPGTTVGIMPPGIGIVVVAADDNEIWNNTVTGNRSVGIAVISYISEVFGSPNDPAFDRFSEGNYVHDNTLANNAADPDALVILLNGAQTPGPEVVIDGCTDPDKDNASGALDNCFAIGSTSFYHADACNQGDGPHEDPEPYACTHPPLPTSLPGLE
jgi:parallel beta-helix repeat protein